MTLPFIQDIGIRLGDTPFIRKNYILQSDSRLGMQLPNGVIAILKATCLF